MTMKDSENANTIIRNRTQLAPLIGKRISFIGYLCSFSKNKYGDTANYPYVALLIDVFNSKYKLNLEHLHVELTESDYQMLKNRIDLFIAFAGTIFTYEAHVRSTYKNKHQKIEYRILREPRYGVEDVGVENVNMADKLDQFNIEFNSILTIYESYALRQIITNLKKLGFT